LERLEGGTSGADSFLPDDLAELGDALRAQADAIDRANPPRAPVGVWASKTHRPAREGTRRRAGTGVAGGRRVVWAAAACLALVGLVVGYFGWRGLNEFEHTGGQVADRQGKFDEGATDGADFKPADARVGDADSLVAEAETAAERRPTGPGGSSSFRVNTSVIDAAWTQELTGPELEAVLDLLPAENMDDRLAI